MLFCFFFHYNIIYFAIHILPVDLDAVSLSLLVARVEHLPVLELVALPLFYTKLPVALCPPAAVPPRGDDSVRILLAESQASALELPASRKFLAGKTYV